MELNAPASVKSDKRLQHLFVAAHATLLTASILVGVIAWRSHGSLWNTWVSTVEFKSWNNGEPVVGGHFYGWMESENLWIGLLLAFFFSGKVLIQSVVKGRIRRLLLFFVLFSIAVLVVWFRLVQWSAWASVTECHKVIGQPLDFLFVPLAFFLADWFRDKDSMTVVFLTGRAFFELALIPIWIMAWGLIQLFFLGWLWI